MWRQSWCYSLCVSSVVSHRQQQMAHGWLPARPCQQEFKVEVTLVGDGEARLVLSESRQQCSPVLCFPVFKGICSLIRHRKQLATCWWEPMEKNTLFYQLCFPYPLVAFAGCGNRQHSGHCCSEIAFTDQSRRTGCIQPGEPGAVELYTGMDNVHYLWFGHKEARNIFIVRFGRLCFQTLSIFLHAGPHYLLVSFSLQQFDHIYYYIT